MGKKKEGKKNKSARKKNREEVTLDFAQACAIQREAESLLDGAEHEPDSRQVLQLARDSGCSAYDCEFIALAGVLGTRLLTMDGQLLRAFPDIAVPLAAE